MTGKNFVGFSLSSLSTHTFRTTNPVSGESNATEFFEATDQEADLAVHKAISAYNQISKISLHQRAFFLREIANEILQLDADLVNMFCQESGLSEERALIERTRTVHQLNAFAEEVEKGDWIRASIDEANQNAIPPKPDLRKMMIGLGPVVVFGASNFPLAYSTAGGDTASALAAGCPVIVKAHPMHAGTGELVAQAIVRAAKTSNMPDGIFSNLNARAYHLGHYLVQHPGICAVGFTGSLKGGRALFDLANQREVPIPVFAEMGSVNPIVILPEILLLEHESISSQIADSVTNSAGQFCTKPGVIVLTKSKSALEFVDLLERKMLARIPMTMLHPEIHGRYEQRKSDIYSCEILSFSECKMDIGNNQGQQVVVTVNAKQFLNQNNLQEEVFGPLSIVVYCEDLTEIGSVLEVLDGQLTTSFFGTDKEILENQELFQQAKQKAGRIIFNGVPTGVTVCPSMHHGGTYPATTDSRFTAVGVDAMNRFLRPVSFQNCPQQLLPLELKEENPLNISRRMNGEWLGRIVHKKD